jgi:hypothetical protein
MPTPATNPRSRRSRSATPRSRFGSTTFAEWAYNYCRLDHVVTVEGERVPESTPLGEEPRGATEE